VKYVEAFLLLMSIPAFALLIIGIGIYWPPVRKRKP
jgi:hypothetical protein